MQKIIKKDIKQSWLKLKKKIICLRMIIKVCLHVCTIVLIVFCRKLFFLFLFRQTIHITLSYVTLIMYSKMISSRI